MIDRAKNLILKIKKPKAKHGELLRISHTQGTE